MHLYGASRRRYNAIRVVIVVVRCSSWTVAGCSVMFLQRSSVASARSSSACSICLGSHAQSSRSRNEGSSCLLISRVSIVSKNRWRASSWTDLRSLAFVHLRASSAFLYILYSLVPSISACLRVPDSYRTSFERWSRSCRSRTSLGSILTASRSVEEGPVGARGST